MLGMPHRGWPITNKVPQTCLRNPVLGWLGLFRPIFARKPCKPGASRAQDVVCLRKTCKPSFLKRKKLFLFKKTLGRPEPRKSNCVHSLFPFSVMNLKCLRAKAATSLTRGLPNPILCPGRLLIEQLKKTNATTPECLQRGSATKPKGRRGALDTPLPERSKIFPILALFL